MESHNFYHFQGTGKNCRNISCLSASVTYLFQLCDHPKNNHLSEFRRATKQRFNGLQLEKTNNNKIISE